MYPMLSLLPPHTLLILLRPLSLLTLCPPLTLSTLLSLLKHLNTKYTVTYMPTYIAPCLERSADLALWLFGLLSKNKDGVDWIVDSPYTVMATRAPPVIIKQKY